MKRVAVTVKGFVQGVGYRRYAEKCAIELHLKGWVKNLENGDVYCVAEGSNSDLDQFLQKLHKGPAFARVADINVEWLTATSEFSDFTIRY